jgi:hypothetical protein
MDRAAAGIPAAVVQPDLVAVSKFGLPGERQELVSG